MSLAEVKASIATMSVAERLEIAALIAHVNRVEDPDFQRDLDGRLDEMDKGNKATQTELERLHKELSSKGQ